jgi:hypothetical protein
VEGDSEAGRADGTPGEEQPDAALEPSMARMAEAPEAGHDDSGEQRWRRSGGAGGEKTTVKT